MGFIIGLIYTIIFISIAYSLAQIATHLKAVKEILEGLRIHLESIKETMRRDQVKRMWSEGEEKK